MTFSLIQRNKGVTLTFSLIQRNKGTVAAISVSIDVVPLWNGNGNDVNRCAIVWKHSIRSLSSWTRRCYSSKQTTTVLKKGKTYFVLE